MGRKEFHTSNFTKWWILVAGRTYLREIAPLVKHCVHGLNNGTDVRFQADAADAHFSGLLGQLFREMNCDHQDRNFRKELRDLPGNVNPIQIRHLEVQQDHIGRMFLHPLYRFSSCRSFITDSPSALLFEEASKIVSNRRVVVYHKDSNQAAPPSLLSSLLSRFRFGYNMTNLATVKTRESAPTTWRSQL